MRKIELFFVIVGLLAISFLASGCVESQKVWGKGELPADYVSYFGDDNTARLNKAQSDMLNRHNAVIHGLDQVKDGKKVRISGLVDYVNTLDARLKVLEAVDPNEVMIEKFDNYGRLQQDWNSDIASKINEIIDSMNEK